MRLAKSDRFSNAHRRPRAAGVTLIELIVVITITGIIATVLGVLIVRPIEGYEALVRRGELVDAAEMALQKMTRDIHQALPNSIRVQDSLGNTNSITCSTTGVSCAIEMLNTLDGGRYRAGPGVNPGGGNYAPSQYWLSFNGPDTDGFNVVSQFWNFTPTLPFTSTTQRLAIYNQGVTGANAYADAGNTNPNTSYVITNPSITTFKISDLGDEDNIIPVTGTFNFSFASPNQRVFIVDKPVSYLCNSGAGGNITRYENYNISATQPTTAAAFTTAGALLTTPVTTCTFKYTPGTNQRAGVVTLDIIVQDPASGEKVRLLYQVQVDNSP
ncbi:MAG: prepilin-type N-terminal cleavage/methylation domain-containing protein [Sulfuricaulis sp.]